MNNIGNKMKFLNKKDSCRSDDDGNVSMVDDSELYEKEKEKYHK